MRGVDGFREAFDCRADLVQLTQYVQQVREAPSYTIDFVNNEHIPSAEGCNARFQLDTTTPRRATSFFLKNDRATSKVQSVKLKGSVLLLG
jgi:hypothetical protein